MTIRHGIHYTNVNPDVIIMEGFHPTQDGYTIRTDAEVSKLTKETCPKIRCFVSNPEYPIAQYNTYRYKMEIDLTGMNLYPDFANLIEIGAYVDEDFNCGDVYFWFKDRTIESFMKDGREELANYLIANEGCIFPDEFSGELSFELIGTACVDGTHVTPERIISWTNIYSE